MVLQRRLQQAATEEEANPQDDNAKARNKSSAVLSLLASLALFSYFTSVPSSSAIFSDPSSFFLSMSCKLRLSSNTPSSAVVVAFPSSSSAGRRLLHVVLASNRAYQFRPLCSSLLVGVSDSGR
ncbi:hypothetical protein PIB30_058952 [Stylosanthes scabra]|uniref:Transmembrane protein n=1 Tax=Stylosanthes scabra TaxID=79078 RepID=A0ABU6QJQ9_9FABA|nr:hypothetical protein [Stylosanthes scabra]